MVRLYPVRGRRGALLRLRYRVSDDAGHTSECITVYRRTRVQKKFFRALRKTDSAVAYWVAWRAPGRRFTGRFCVRATDRAGSSATSCASLRIR